MGALNRIKTIRFFRRTKFLFFHFPITFYIEKTATPKGSQVYARNNALLRRISRPRWNEREERGKRERRESSPIKNNLPSRLVDKVYAVDNIIVLTESWALVNVIQHDYITGNLKNPRPSVKTSNLPVPRVDYLIAYRSIYRCYRIYIFISYIYTVCISVSTNN